MMPFLDEILEEIRNKEISDKEKIDLALEKDRDIRDLGKKFTTHQKNDARKQSRYIYRYMKNFGEEGKQISYDLLKTIDK
mgnify:CR=1 FL=1